jgi:hypothetical protein
MDFYRLLDSFNPRSDLHSIVHYRRSVTELTGGAKNVVFGPVRVGSDMLWDEDD